METLKSAFQIRQYQSADKDEVLSLHVLALEEAGVYLGSGEWDADLQIVEEVYINPGGEFLVGLLNDRIAAMGALKRISEGRAEIKRMRVHPQFQRLGFGQMILDALERIAREKEVKTLILETSTLQVAAQALYEKNGYSKVRRGVLLGFEIVFYEKQLAFA